ncbi:MAG: hypothetical protein GVY21_04620 [Gammaproteobacteria bacterium]|nr:hypothetical protein [Gammaproteobacteria bacterium]
MEVRATRADDQTGVLALYRRVANVPGGLARLADEVYVADFLERTLADGVGFVAADGTSIVGEIHACRPVPFCFSHVLSDLTIAFYEHLGFRCEGRMEGRIRNLDGSFEADIPMAWSRPADA